MPCRVAVSNTISITCLLIILTGSGMTHGPPADYSCSGDMHPSTPHQERTALSGTYVPRYLLREASWNTWSKSPKCCDGQGIGLRPGTHTFKQKKKKKATNWNASVFLIPWEAEQCTHKEAGETMWPYQILVEHCSPLQVPGSSPWQVIPGSASSWQDLCLGHQSPRSRHFNLENEEYTITMSLLTMELLRAGTLDLPNHWQETAHLVMPAWQPHFSHRWNGTAASWAAFNSSHLQTNTKWLRVILRVDRGLSFVLGEQCVWLPEWRGKPNQVDRQHSQTSKH